MIRTIASPTPTSAAATAITNKANTAPATSALAAPNVSRLMLTALRISSIDISTITVFLRAITPYTPIAKRIAASRRNWLSIRSSIAAPSAVLSGDDDGAHERRQQQHRHDLERDQVLREDRVAHRGGVAAADGVDLPVGGQGVVAPAVDERVRHDPRQQQCRAQADPPMVVGHVDVA